MRYPSGNSGFTLIEVIVVTAIVAILAGIMVPSVWRVWDQNDEETTRERMRSLKAALVGDARLIENGVRTSFGYLGDVGQLPTSLANLVANVDGAANWRGPYLAPGFDPSTYDLDAWGRAIVYATSLDGAGRRAAAGLASAGPDGANGTADDIADAALQVSSTETVPLASISGNLNITFQTAPQAVRNLYIGVRVRYPDGAGGTAVQTCCDGAVKTVTGSAGNTQVNYTLLYSCAPAVTVPAGIVYLNPRVYSDAACSASLGGTTLQVASTVGSASLYANLQHQAVP